MSWAISCEFVLYTTVHTFHFIKCVLMIQFPMTLFLSTLFLGHFSMNAFPNSICEGASTSLCSCHKSWYHCTRPSTICIFSTFEDDYWTRIIYIFCRRDLSPQQVSKKARYSIISLQRILFSELTYKSACSSFVSNTLSFSRWSLNECPGSMNRLSKYTLT